MPARWFRLPVIALAPWWAPRLIAAGLVLIAFSSWSPTLPAVTGMALVFLGATLATVEQFRASPVLLPILVAHAAVYGSLYALFVGATLHSASRTDACVGWIVATDLGLSLWPIAAAVGQVLDAMRGKQLAE